MVRPSIKVRLLTTPAREDGKIDGNPSSEKGINPRERSGVTALNWREGDTALQGCKPEKQPFQINRKLTKITQVH